MTAASGMRVTGALAVIIGGLIAALTAPLALTRGSWAAAYLVLVVGVAQVAMGMARQQWTAADSRRHGDGWWQLACWNIGSIGVIAGTLLGATAIVALGSALLVAALVLAFLATLAAIGDSDTRPSDTRHSARRRGARRHRALLIGYRALLVVLTVSIPVGVILSWIRHG